MVIGRLTATSADASFAAVAAIIGLLFASLVNCPQVRIKSVSKAGIGITAATPPLGPIMVEDDDRESQEDDIKPCGLPGVRPDSPPLSYSLANQTAAECLHLPSDFGAKLLALLMKAHASFSAP